MGEYNLCIYRRSFMEYQLNTPDDEIDEDYADLIDAAVYCDACGMIVTESLVAACERNDCPQGMGVGVEYYMPLDFND
jgi:hypothetical protein